MRENEAVKRMFDKQYAEKQIEHDEVEAGTKDLTYDRERQEEWDNKLIKVDERYEKLDRDFRVSLVK